MGVKADHTQAKYGWIAKVFRKHRSKKTPALDVDVCLIADDLADLFEKEDRKFDFWTFMYDAECVTTEDG
tara:strand:+ start:183 stop:392 length:210 start_codon:yes stop_codon:yes gene_type:complete